MRKHFLLYINNSTTIKISQNFLVVVHIVIHNGSTTGTYTEACNIAFKTSKPL